LASGQQDSQFTEIHGNRFGRRGHMDEGRDGILVEISRPAGGTVDGLCQVNLPVAQSGDLVDSNRPPCAGVCVTRFNRQRPKLFDTSNSWFPGQRMWW